MGKKNAIHIWSKTTLIESGVGGAGVDPPPTKMDTFFLRSLALSVPIYINFQSNGAKKIYIMPYYIKKIFQSLKLHLIGNFYKLAH